MQGLDFKTAPPLPLNKSRVFPPLPYLAVCLQLNIQSSSRTGWGGGGGGRLGIMPNSWEEEKSRLAREREEIGGSLFYFFFGGGGGVVGPYHSIPALFPTQHNAS